MIIFVNVLGVLAANSISEAPIALQLDNEASLEILNAFSNRTDENLKELFHNETFIQSLKT